MQIKIRNIQSRDVKVGDILIYPYSPKMVGMLPYVVTKIKPNPPCANSITLNSGTFSIAYDGYLMSSRFLNITDSLSQKQKENAVLAIMSQAQTHPQNINEASKTDINADCIGEPINIGDNVLFTKAAWGASMLYLGKVVSLTPKKVRITYARNREIETTLIDKHRVFNMNSYIIHYPEMFL